MYSIYKQLFNEKKKLSATQRFVFVVIIFSFFLIIIESENSIKSINPYIFEYLNIFLSYFFLTEYSLRLMCCGYTKKYKGFLGKIRFIFNVLVRKLLNYKYFSWFEIYLFYIGLPYILEGSYICPLICDIHQKLTHLL